MKKLYLLFFFILLSSQSSLFALSTTVSGKTEMGRKSVPEETAAQEDDLSIVHTFLDVDFRANENFQVEAKTTYWEKDYRSLSGFDNVTRIYGVTPTCRLYQKDSRVLRLRVKTARREKRYLQQPSINFNQTTIAPTLLFEKEKNYLAFSLGWNDTHYVADSKFDQSNITQETKLKKSFLEGNLDLKSSYRIDWNEFDRAGREKVKHDVEGGAHLKLYESWIREFVLAGSFGKRDSKEAEDREEDIDFSFWDYRLRSKHPILPNLMGTIQFSSFERDFRTNRFDSNGWEVIADMDYLKIEGDPQNLRFDFQTKFKKVEYPSDSNNSYRKVTSKIGATYRKKKRWNGSLGYEAHLYRFDLSSQDKLRHLILASVGRWFKEGKFYLSFSSDYRFTDRIEEADDRSSSASVSFRTHF